MNSLQTTQYSYFFNMFVRLNITERERHDVTNNSILDMKRFKRCADRFRRMRDRLSAIYSLHKAFEDGVFYISR